GSILADGFSLAHRRLRPIVLDLVWKLIWLGVFGSLMAGLSVWLYWKLRSIEIQASAEAVRNPVALMLLARQLRDRYAEMFVWIFLVFLITAALSWILLEAYCRSGILPDSRASFFQSAARYFKRFIVSSALKQGLMIVLSIPISVIVFGPYITAPPAEWRNLWLDSRGLLVVAGLIGIALWLVVTIFETAIRADVLDLLRRDVFTVAGLIAILLIFEGMIVASAVGLGAIMMSFVTDAVGVLMVLMVAVGTLIVLNILHSYLLVVRYSTLTVLSRTSSVHLGTSIIGHVDEFRDSSHTGFWFPVHPTDRTPHS
ncbi:MAG TPA: hypothetical protein VKB78_17595, partial [Pirellulales bacterium]|nr:hypothetical protein [Pirellulales bacterium]